MVETRYRIVPSPVVYGCRISGNVVRFEVVGAELDWHIQWDDSHIAIVATGKLRLDTRGPAPSPIVIVRDGVERTVGGDESAEVSAGDLIDIPVGIDHRFVALEDDTRMFSLLKDYVLRGEPQGFPPILTIY